MIGNEERNRLMRDYRREPVYAWGIVLRCAAGLAIVGLIATIGLQTGSEQQDVAAIPAKHVTERASLSHSKRLYEERGARFRSAQETGVTAASRT